MKIRSLVVYLSTVLCALSFGSRSAHAATTISTFTGGDLGEGLDLQGKFIYAVGVGTDQTPGKAGDADFTMDDVPGVTLEFVNRLVAWLMRRLKSASVSPPGGVHPVRKACWVTAIGCRFHCPSRRSAHSGRTSTGRPPSLSESTAAVSRVRRKSLVTITPTGKSSAASRLARRST